MSSSRYCILMGRHGTLGDLTRVRPRKRLQRDKPDVTQAKIPERRMTQDQARSAIGLPPITTNDTDEES